MSDNQTCATHDSVESGTMLDKLVHRYIDQHRERAKRELRYYAIQRELEDVIELAALAKLPNGNRHPHQRRVPGAALMESHQRLLMAKQELQSCRSFETLIGTVSAIIRPIKGIGPVTVYDTSLRLGAFLGLEPERVYLHAGTRAGAEGLSLDSGRDVLGLEDLPELLDDLTPREVEDFLCIYKDSF